ncbi:hypothetical protein NUU61_002030 [Penicillium alfredii]|uniref:Uncharacterized protein n=1 Tax=Penicillium alfredii TaxID=1506179 RepID=A0A9W9KGG5_9EURO|nr:uncharacterized protein NUU61_002030 [Penicillium alfredii]KAJ5104683.1 hypothetical protein NUU61_002030 [Penicillium alfredii]
MEPDTLDARWDGHRLSSSSFSRQGWPRLSPSYAPPMGTAGPSHPASARYSEFAIDESDRVYRATALHQTDEEPRLQSRAGQAGNPISGPASTAGTKPVLVRAYSGAAKDTTRKPSTMSPRRFFPFMASRNSAPPRPPGPPLPSDQDFSIDSILQAIEPDIRGTLDSIAEICGRSKLSLANEYGSHIAPLGEIRAPPGGLVPVEEASSNDERHADEGVAIFDDATNLVDSGQSPHAFPFYRYLECLGQTAPLMERSTLPGTSVQAQPGFARSAALNTQLETEIEISSDSLPVTRDFTSRPKQSGRDLLAENAASSDDDHPPQNIITPAVVSEVHLDAQADDRNARTEYPLPPSLHDPVSPTSPEASSEHNIPDVLRSLLGWLRWTTRFAGPDSYPELQSAEGRLRAMLEHSARGSPLPTT